MTILERCAEYVLSLNDSTIAPEAKTLAKTFFIDCLGCMIAGAHGRPSQIAMDYCEKTYGTEKRDGIIVGFLIYRELSWKDMGSILLNTVKTSSMILFIIAAATAFAYVLTIENVPNIIAGAVMSFATEKWQFWVFVTILLFITGMVMETTPAIMILAPILMPMLPQYGIDPVAFGVVMIINLGIGYVTPPVGLNLYVAAGLVPGAKVGDVVNKHTVVYILLAFIVLIVLMAFPQIIMLLPNMME